MWDLFIQNNFTERFEEAFSYARTGWQYTWKDYRIFVEDIEHLGASIEIEATAVEKLQTILQTLPVREVYHDSMAELMRKKLHT